MNPIPFTPRLLSSLCVISILLLAASCNRGVLPSEDLSTKSLQQQAQSAETRTQAIESAGDQGATLFSYQQPGAATGPEPAKDPSESIAQDTEEPNSWPESRMTRDQSRAYTWRSKRSSAERTRATRQMREAREARRKHIQDEPSLAQNGFSENNRHRTASEERVIGLSEREARLRYAQSVAASVGLKSAEAMELLNSVQSMAQREKSGSGLSGFMPLWPSLGPMAIAPPAASAAQGFNFNNGLHTFLFILLLLLALLLVILIATEVISALGLFGVLALVALIVLLIVLV